MRNTESNQNWPQFQDLTQNPTDLLYAKEVCNLDAILCKPIIDQTAWVSPGAILIGRVQLKAHSSIWYGCVLRGDNAFIEIGEETNVQDGSILHAESASPCILGKRVTLGHRATVHASIVEDDAMIGIGAIVLSHCIIGKGSLIAAGSVVREGTHVPPETLWAGVPAKHKSNLSQEKRERITNTSKYYVNLAASYIKRFGRKHIDELSNY